jgi:alpha-tubulin suppressor-like RCC1 family protein
MQQIASGIEHTLVCTSSGRLFAFGSSKDGQVGNGQELNVDLPIELAKTYPNNGRFDQLPLLEKERVIQVSCGYHHSAVVTSRGVLYTWGRDTEGCLGHGAEMLAAGPWSDSSRSSFMPCVVRAFLLEKIVTGGRGGAAAASAPSAKVGSFATKLTALVRVAIKSVSCGSEHTVVGDTNGKLYFLHFSFFFFFFL